MKGRINISRWSSSVEPHDGIRIEVIDEQSRVHFLRIDMTLEEFAFAVTGCGERHCEFELRGAETVGKTRENKEEIVEVDSDVLRDRDLTRARRALEPFEVDGWVGDVSNLFNRHRVVAYGATTDSNKVRVSFTRYVNKGEQA